MQILSDALHWKGTARAYQQETGQIVDFDLRFIFNYFGLFHLFALFALKLEANLKANKMLNFKRQTIQLVSCEFNGKHFAWIKKHKLGYMVHFKHDPELPVFACSMKYAKQEVQKEIDAQ